MSTGGVYWEQAPLGGRGSGGVVGLLRVGVFLWVVWWVGWSRLGGVRVLV